MMRLQGKTAVVTGASRGIGRGIAMRLGQEGASVIVNYAKDQEAAYDTVRSIEGLGGQAVAVQGDVAESDSVERLFQSAADIFGPATVLVNNAGITDVHKPWQEITEAEWDHVLAVNLKSCFLCFRSAYPAMVDAQWGRVVNISSVTYWLGQANLLHYVSAKAGMIGFTRTLSREVGDVGITVNAVTPGAIRTESELEMFPDQINLERQLYGAQGIKRRGLPADIAATVAFLASEDSSFITGQTVNVDGGWAMH